MQGVCVIWIQGKNLLAAKLGVQMPSGAHVTETGFMERSDPGRCGSILASFGSLGGRSALARFHQRLSKCLDSATPK
jgi:hypothetical protein